jgi:glycosyltransferase involved in cell wall biosynthesis
MDKKIPMEGVSVLIIYRNRIELLRNTLSSFEKQLIDGDEIIVVDDGSSEEHVLTEKDFTGVRIFRFTPEEKTWKFPSIPINKGISMVKNNYVLFQGAEILHYPGVVEHLRSTCQQNVYNVYGCFSLDKGTTPTSPKGIWYQHSVYNPRCLNFCVGIHREDLLDLGGFDERYGVGTNYGDDDFLMRVHKKGMEIRQIDFPYTYHQWHEKEGIINNGKLFEQAQEEPEYRVKNRFL